jgi:hypothetical protein
MWLSDDDWIDPEYARRCLDELLAEPRRKLVCGQARYYSDGAWFADERPIDLASRRPALRVLAYYALVNMNGPLFGVVRRADLLEVPFQEVPGGDWLLVAELAARGEVRTLRDVHVHRSADGLGGDEERLARSFGLIGWMARWHHVWVAGKVWSEIAHRRHGSGTSRAVTATLAAMVLLLRYPVVELLRRVGLGGLEARAVAWARARRE